MNPVPRLELGKVNWSQYGVDLEEAMKIYCGLRSYRLDCFSVLLQKTAMYNQLLVVLDAKLSKLSAHEMTQYAELRSLHNQFVFTVRRIVSLVIIYLNIMLSQHDQRSGESAVLTPPFFMAADDLFRVLNENNAELDDCKRGWNIERIFSLFGLDMTPFVCVALENIIYADICLVRQAILLRKTLSELYAICNFHVRK